jgi:hypothetical protein
MNDQKNNTHNKDNEVKQTPPKDSEMKQSDTKQGEKASTPHSKY